MGSISRYLGSFSIDESLLPGEIVHNEDTGAILLRVTKKFPTLRDWQMESTAPPEYDENFAEETKLDYEEHIKRVRLYHRLGFISGTLNNGKHVTLFNCRCDKDISNLNKLSRHLEFYVSYIVWGDSKCISPSTAINSSDAKTISEVRRYHKYVCILENALEWATISRVHPLANSKLEIVPVSNRLKFTWFGVQVKFTTKLESDIWDGQKQEEYTLSEHLQLELSSEQPLQAIEFLSIRDKIIAMISFAIKGNINILHQYLNHNDDYITYNFTDAIDYFEYEITSNEPRRRTWETDPSEYNFTLNQFKGRDMSKTLTKLEPIFNLYGSLYRYTDMPLEMIFLNVIQAIEKFHSEFHKYGTKKKYLEKIQKRFSNFKQHPELKLLFMSEGQMNEHTDYVILLSQLSDLLVEKATPEDLFYPFYGLDPDFPHRITATRHYYTHYGQAKKDLALRGDDLYDAIKILKLILEYHVCKELYVDVSDKIREKLDEYFIKKSLSRYFLGSP